MVKCRFTSALLASVLLLAVGALVRAEPKWHEFKELNQDLQVQVDELKSELAAQRESLQQARGQLAEVEAKLQDGQRVGEFKSCRTSAEELDQLRKVELSLANQVKGLRSVNQSQQKQLDKVRSQAAGEEQEALDFQNLLEDKQAALGQVIAARDSTKAEAEKNIADFKECAKNRVGAQLRALSDWDNKWHGGDRVLSV